MTMKTVSSVESKFINQFSNMVRAFEIENGISFNKVALSIDATGTIGYEIALKEVVSEVDAPA